MLIGSRVRLRAIERDDLPRFVAWLNDPEVRRTLVLFAPMSLAAEEAWYQGLAGDPSRHVFAIDAKGADEWSHVGTCGLERVDLRAGSATLGIFVGERSRWGQGIATEAIELLLRFGFEELRLNRVELEVFDLNTRGRRVYDRLGFVLEGTRRQAHFLEGRYVDAHTMSLLAEEWRAGKGRA